MCFSKINWLFITGRILTQKLGQIIFTRKIIIKTKQNLKIIVQYNPDGAREIRSVIALQVINRKKT